ILTREPEAAAIVAPRGTLLGEGEVLVNHDLAAYLEALGRDAASASFYTGVLAHDLAARMDEGDALLTVDDLAHYRVVEREPLRTPSRGTTLLTTPPPSFGGALIALALELDEARGEPVTYQSALAVSGVVEVMIEVDRRRQVGMSKGTTQMTVADA